MAHAYAAMFLATRELQIQFAFETGAVVTQTFKACETINTAKAKIYATESRLIFNGKQLEDDRTLFDYNIGQNAAIQVLLLTRQPRTPDARNEPPAQRWRYTGEVNYVGYDASQSYRSWFAEPWECK